MDLILQQQIARARRRMNAELFLRRLVACSLAGLSVACLAIAVPKLFPVNNLPAAWGWWWLGGGTVAACLSALVWCVWRPATPQEAAEEIDRRFGLRERVASSLSLGPHVDSAAAQAVLHDAARAVQRVHVAERFGVSAGRRAWTPLVPLALAAGLMLFVDNREAQSRVEATTAADQVATERAAQSLRERLVERQKQAAQQGLKDAEQLFRELEREAERLAVDKEADRKQALVRLTDLAQQLEQRRERLGDGSELRKELANLKQLQQGPAESLTKALQQGDWQRAQQELNRLQQQLEQGQLSESDRDQLQRQLEQVRQQLEQAAAEREQARQDLAEQVERLKQQGELSAAAQMQQKLAQLQQQQAQSDRAQQLAEQMGQCQQALQQGDAQAAAEAMQKMAGELAQLQQAAAEGELLATAMEQIDMAKEAMACSQCAGEGCAECQGGNPSQSAQASAAQTPTAGQGKGQMPGPGQGEGPGGGTRPDEENPTQFRDSTVKQQPGAGASVWAGEAEGANLRGQVREAVKQEMEASTVAPADPLAVEQLPKARRQHVEEYFNRLREGQP